VSSRHYTGGGNRQTPLHISDTMADAARVFAEQGRIMRSGHSGYADMAFERGALHGWREIYLPWPGFNGGGHRDSAQTMIMERPDPQAFTILQTILDEEHWGRLNSQSRALHARNVHMMLGPRLNDPSHFFLCWTPGARTIGGTGVAIRIAEYFGIEVHNLAMATTQERIKKMLAQTVQG
jgi:hypothetical protein